MNGLATGKIALTNLVLVLAFLIGGIVCLSTDQHDTGLALVNVAIGTVIGAGTTGAAAKVTANGDGAPAPPKP